MIEFEYTIKNGKLFVDRRNVFDAYVSGMKEGFRGLLRFTRRRGKAKTLAQLGYYWVAILPTIHTQLVADGHEIMGIAINQDMAHDIVKHFCAKVRDGEYVTMSDMSKMEAMEFMDNAMRWAAKVLRVVIPEPTNTEGSL
jgi:hypothetical protein